MKEQIRELQQLIIEQMLLDMEAGPFCGRSKITEQYSKALRNLDSLSLVYADSHPYRMAGIPEIPAPVGSK